MVKSDREQGVRQNLSAIFGSRTMSFRCRRPRANKEEEVGGARSPASLTACLACLIFPDTSALFSFCRSHNSTQHRHPMPDTFLFFYSTLHYEQVVLLIFFPPRDGCYMINTIFSFCVSSCKMSQIKCPRYPSFSVVSLKLFFVLFCLLLQCKLQSEFMFCSLSARG